MADDPFANEHGSLTARLFQEPVRLRRWSRWSALFLVILVALASDGPGGAIPGFVFPLAWLCLPFVAFGIGFGGAFFIRHGISIRLETLMLVGGVLAAIGTCVLLSTASSEGDGGALGRLVEAALYGLQYGGLLSLVAALVGFGLGRGLDYAGRRIESLSDEDW